MVRAVSQAFCGSLIGRVVFRTWRGQVLRKGFGVFGGAGEVVLVYEHVARSSSVMPASVLMLPPGSLRLRVWLLRVVWLRRGW